MVAKSKSNQCGQLQERAWWLIFVCLFFHPSHLPFTEVGVLQLFLLSSTQTSKFSDKGIFNQRITPWVTVGTLIAGVRYCNISLSLWNIFLSGSWCGSPAFVNFFFSLLLLYFFIFFWIFLHLSGISFQKGYPFYYVIVTYWRWWQTMQGGQITVIFIFPSNVSCENWFCVAISRTHTCIAFSIFLHVV